MKSSSLIHESCSFSTYCLIIAALAIVSIARGEVYANERELLEYRVITGEGHQVATLSPLGAIDAFLRINELDKIEDPISIDLRTVDTKVIADLFVKISDDDSLLGENYRLIIENADGLYFLRCVGVQYICARGRNVGEAQKGYCP